MKLTEIKRINEGHQYDDPGFTHFTDRAEIVKWIREHSSPTVTGPMIKVKPDGTTNLDIQDYSLVRFTKQSGKFHKLPVKFGEVKFASRDGTFDISDLGLHTLENCPKHIIGGFDATKNKLSDLVGGPQNVSGNFEVSSNRLTTLKGCPKIIMGDFGCNDNDLISLADGPYTVEGTYDVQHNYLDHIDCEHLRVGSFYVGHNKLKTLDDFSEDKDAVTDIDSLYVDEAFFKQEKISVLPLLHFKKFDWKGFIQYNHLPSKMLKIMQKYAGSADQIFECQQELIEAGFERYAS